MIRIVFSFLVGVVAAISFPDTVYAHAVFLFLVGGCIGYGVLFFTRRRGTWGLIAGVLGLSIIAAAGFVRTFVFTDANSPHHLIAYRGAVRHYVVTVTKPGEEKSNTWRYEVLIQRVHDGKKWIRVTGKMLLYVRKGAQNISFLYGDEVVVSGMPQLIEPPSNPHAFSFKKFMGFKNTYHQHVVKPAHLRLISSGKHNDIKYYAYKAQAWATERIKTYVKDSRIQTIALALTLGVSDGIDNDLRKAYAASGAMHVLAVSGLHVGIIYGIIIFMLMPLRSFSWGYWIIAAVSVAVLWAYAFLTGLSPSVLRAVTMFSFVALARLLRRNTSIYNTLAGSAFLLLLFNPYLIVSVGFQLSYLAVLGIVSLHRPLYLLWEPRYAFLDWVWSITCVSLSAQLATFALGLLYFHQLPVYFLLANLFVLPGAMVILIGSILVIATSFLPPLATAIGIGLQWFIGLLNKGIFAVERIPFSLINNIYITPLQCFLLMVIVCLCILLLTQKKYRYLVMALVCMATFFASRWAHFYHEVLPKRLVVYAVAGHTGVEWIEKGTSYFYRDESLVKNNEYIRFNILPNRLFCDVSSTKVNHYDVGDGRHVTVFSKGGVLVAIVNKQIRSWPKELRVNYLIVGNNAFSSLEEIERVFQFDRLILSSSNAKNYCKRIVQEGKGKDIFIHSVLHQGAYTHKL